MFRVVVLNPKGGSGKTTLATNLAAHYAGTGWGTALMDYDNQGSSSYWVSRRSSRLPPVQAVNAWKQQVPGVTRSWLLRLPQGTERVVIDTPAAVNLNEFRETLQSAQAIIVPVLPSAVDIHAASRCIADPLLVAKIDRKSERIAVVANRVRKTTLTYHKLESFLKNLGIPFVATLRDTQNYVKAYEEGRSVFELDSSGVDADVESWQGLLQWLEARSLREISGGSAA